MSFAVSSIAMMGVGAVSSAVGSYYGAQSQKSSLNFAAGIADINAGMAEKSAQAELERGAREFQASRLKTANLKSRQKVAIAANGVDMGSGSAQAILNTTDIMGEIDAKEIEVNATRSAWGYRQQGTQYQNEALIKRSSADSIDPNSALFSGLISGAAQVGASYYSMKKAGAFDTPKTPSSYSLSGPGLNPNADSSPGLKMKSFWG